ncbi:MAG TPA: hypothetical protein GX734_06310 [Clostridiaceae bacterium]|nr:hypothetical protein [Clostridiaceae bacterium]
MTKSKTMIRKWYVLTLLIVVVALFIVACQKANVVLDKENKSDSTMCDDKSILDRKIDSGILSDRTLVGSKTNQGFSMCECAADTYRPDGYHPRIGSALALKLSLHKDVPEMVYDVVIPCIHRFGEEDACMVERLGDRLDRSSWKCWTRILWPNCGIEEKYHAQLTRDQINIVVESGLWCLYLGSGKGNLTEMSFDNPKGIETYCELVGDMYTFAADGSILYKPDLIAEGLVELDP